LFYSVSSVQRAANLLVSFDKSLQLNCQVFILSKQNVAVVLQSINFCLDVHVLGLKRLVGEPQVCLLTTASVEIVFSDTALTVKFKQGLRKTPITVLFLF
jgi:hypothetical protein